MSWLPVKVRAAMTAVSSASLPELVKKLFAKKDGHVKFEKKGPKMRQFVSVVEA